MMDNALLWQVTKPESHDQSYILGTIHLSDDWIRKFAEIIKPLIAECKVFATEHDLRQSAAALPGSIPVQHRISNLLSPKQYEKARRIIHKSFRVDIRHFDQLYPIQLSHYLAAQAIRSNVNVSLDSLLWQIAEDAGLQLAGLESIEDTKRIFESIPIAYQKDALISIYRNVAKFRKKVNRSLATYKEQDIQKLYRSGRKSLSNLKSLLLYDRNAQMVDSMIALQRTHHRVFCAVGAAHLAGAKGILRLLKHAGYQIQPVSLPSDLQ